MVRPAARSLNPAPLRQHLDTIVRAAIAAADPAPLVRHALTTPETARLLAQAESLHVIAAGKAIGSLLDAVPVDLARRQAIASGPTSPSSRTGVEWYAGAHPLPDEQSVAAGRRALSIAAAARADDVILMLLSGGASSMMALPAAGISLDEKRQTVAKLLKEGAAIVELNTVRKHLSAIKGGALAAATGARVITVAVSDVVGDDASTIASGPTVGDPTTFAEALVVLESRGGLESYPPAVVKRLRQGAEGRVPETPKPGSTALTRSHMTVIGGSRHVLSGAAAAAERLGYRVRVLERPTVGEAREAGAALLTEARRGYQPGTRMCVLAAGETTVTVRGSGRGGRNQELALSLAPFLSTLGASVAVASVGTDGIDGPTDAAGAFVDRTTLTRAHAADLSVEASLADNDSYRFFERLGDLIHLGATGINAGDVQVILLAD